jgi:hypothetical protein
MVHPGYGLIECARSTKNIMCWGIGAVKADANPLDPSLFDLSGHFFVDKRPVGGQRDYEARIRSSLGDVIYILPKEGFPAGKHENRPAHSSYLVDQVESFMGG